MAQVSTPRPLELENQLPPQHTIGAAGGNDDLVRPYRKSLIPLGVLMLIIMTADALSIIANLAPTARRSDEGIERKQKGGDIL